MLNTGMCNRPGCRYAHNQEELRTSPGLLKTKMCSFFLKGLCVVGEACRFAHSAEELQEAVFVQKATVAKAAPPKAKNQTSLWELRRYSFRVPASDKRVSRSFQPSWETEPEAEESYGPAETVKSRVIVNVNADEDALPLIQSSSACTDSANNSDGGVINGPQDVEPPPEASYTYTRTPKVVRSKSL
jgi:hypothetical protein